jgi:integral membrane protein
VSQISDTFWRFRVIAFVEGLSYLTLLGIAMPLKYIGKMPLPNKIVGWIHGALTVLFVLHLLQVWIERGWSFKRVVLMFIASLLPGGTLVTEYRSVLGEQSLREEAENEQTNTDKEAAAA